MSGFNEGSNSLFLSEFVSNNDLKFIHISNKARVTTIHHEVLQENQVLCDEDQRKYALQNVNSIEENNDNECLFGSLVNNADSCSTLMHDLRASVILLNFSTTRIETDVNELAHSIKNYSAEKMCCQDSQVNLDFCQSKNQDEVSFHTLSYKSNKETTETKSETKESDYEENCINIDHLPLLRKQHCLSEDSSDQQIIMEVIENLECKIKQLDERIVSIDNQHARIIALSNEIKQNEQLIEDLHKVFDYNCCERKDASVSELKVLTAKNVEDSHKQLEHQVQTFMEKIDLNTKRIESAWVGLIAALLLIPIAFFLGKFL